MTKTKKKSENILITTVKSLGVSKMDKPFLICVILLVVIGLVVLFSAGFAQSLLKTNNSYTYILKQIRSVLLGLAAMVFVSIIPVDTYKKFKILGIDIISLYYWVCVVLLIVVLFVGRTTERRWIPIFGMQFQPSEFAKLAVVLKMSEYLANAKKHNKMNSFARGIVEPALIFGVVVALVALEPHLSGAILIAGIGLMMLVAGGSNTLSLILIAILTFLGGGVVVLSNQYMRKRIESFINKGADSLGSGFQIKQSLITIGSGGLFGQGYGQSKQKYLYLPEAQNDFVFSVFSEEMGYIGVIIVLSIFLFFILRGFYIAKHAADDFSSYIAYGIVGKVAIQVALNLLVITETIPTTGIPLPFFSYGGTAMLVQLAEMGFVLQISHASNVAREKQREIDEALLLAEEDEFETDNQGKDSSGEDIDILVEQDV